jgi:hypothetical protein
MTDAVANCRLDEWACTAALDAASFAVVRRRMALDHFNWDPQVGDCGSLAPFALVLPAAVWRTLAALATSLTAEALAVERELLGRPHLLARLGLPPRVLAALTARDPPTPAAARVVRYDFHATSDGWRISEANADVPGGYTEASSFAALMAEQFPGLAPASDPAARLADTLAAAAGPAGRIVLLAAAGYMEDLQIASFFADLLRIRGLSASVMDARQVRWIDGRACVAAAPADVVFRFFQGEWLERLPLRLDWRRYFRGGRTPVCNPATALVVESKRFPLVWPRLASPLPRWRALLPAVCDPRSAAWRRGGDWVLKPAFGNTGDEEASPGWSDGRRWRRAVWSACLRPGHWVAQRRFEAAPIRTPTGLLYPCLGVYTIDGAAAGVYGRVSRRPLIDYAAQDVAILVRPSKKPLSPVLGGEGLG